MNGNVLSDRAAKLLCVQAIVDLELIEKARRVLRDDPMSWKVISKIFDNLSFRAIKSISVREMLNVLKVELNQIQAKEGELT